MNDYIVRISGQFDFECIQRLDLSQMDTAILDLSVLEQCPNLVELNLRQKNLTSSSLTQLVCLKKLRRLDLAQNDIERLDSTTLPTFLELRHLNLDENPIRCQTIDPETWTSLALRLPALESLYISNREPSSSNQAHDLDQPRAIRHAWPNLISLNGEILMLMSSQESISPVAESKPSDIAPQSSPSGFHLPWKGTGTSKKTLMDREKMQEWMKAKSQTLLTTLENELMANTTTS